MSAIAQVPLCSICNCRVELTNARADENGKAVHEECYLNKIKPTVLPGHPSEPFVLPVAV
jgi:hypothetical protein